ncbi:MAG: hypothetical protein IH849_01075, partial [Acidobacteria bacterium]|nr:hypothetical protein [Acidobacteriota bacterium]
MRKLFQLFPCIAALALLTMVVGDSSATVQRHSAHLTVAPVSHRPVNDPGVARVRTDVTITVDGGRRVARVEIEDQFRNNGGRLLEGDYLYPIPPGAVFTDLSLFMGEQELKGEMLPAGTARAIYEEIVRRKKDPALV